MKIFYHTINSSDAILQVLPTYFNKYTWAVKDVDPPVPDLYPNHKVFGRTPPNDNWEHSLVAKGAAGADEWFNANLAYYEARRGAVSAWECVNEPDVSTDDACRKLAAFTLRWTLLMHSRSFKVVVGCFGTGTPQLKKAVPSSNAWTIMAPMLVGADFRSRHSYWYPANGSSPHDLWTALRHRLDEEELVSLGYKMLPPLVITEAGVDGGPVGKMGYKSFGINEEQYTQQFSEFYTELDKDPYVFGACLFTCGPTPDWNSFEVTPNMIRWLAQHANGGIAGTVVTPPIVVPPAQKLVIDGRLMNNEQFEQHVINTNLSWATTVVIHHTAKPTVEDWAQCGWECRKEAMRLYYQNVLGWDSGPHIFVSDEGMGLFSPLSKPGTGVVGHNSDTIHIEIVGDYSTTLPVGKTYDYMISSAAILLKHMPTTTKLTYHSALQVGTQCPGNGIIYNWGQIRDAIYCEVNKVDLSHEEPTKEKIRWHMEQAYRELVAIGVPKCDKGMQRINELVRLDGGLMYRWEQEQ